MDQHGGQSIPNFDYGLAPGVAKTFVRSYQENLTKILMLEGELSDDFEESLKLIKQLAAYDASGKGYPRIGKNLFDEYAKDEYEKLVRMLSAKVEVNDNLEHVVKKAQENAYKFAKRETVKKTYQAMEGFLHNLNTMHSRAGQAWA